MQMCDKDPVPNAVRIEFVGKLSSKRLICFD